MNIRLVVPFSGMLVAPNVFVIVGGETTMMLAVPVFPVPALVEPTVTLLFFMPAIVPSTLTERAQPPLLSVTPDRLTVPPEAVAVPPHELLKFGIDAMTSPAGKESVKPTPERLNPMFGLLMLKFKVVVPFSGIEAAPNVFVMLGGDATVKFVLAVVPVPPLVELTAPVVFVYCPEAVPVTFTITVHDALIPMLPPVKPMLAPPELAAAVPPQPLVNALGVATTKPVGSVSVNATPASATVLAVGLPSVNVRRVVPFKEMDDGLNAFTIEGGATTVTLADAAVPLPPSFEAKVEVVLLFAPAPFPVTFTEKLHEPLAASVPPDKLIRFVPAAAVILPLPQLPMNPLGVETTSPAGKVSVNARPDKLAVALLFWIVKLRLVPPFNGMLGEPNALLRTGGPTTVTLAFEVLPVPPSFEVTCTELFFTPKVVP